MLLRFDCVFLRPQPPVRRGWLHASSLLILALVSAIVGLAPGNSSADTIYLKNGLMLEGVIEQAQSNDAYLVIRTPTGITRVPRTRIDRIEAREYVSGEERDGDLAAQEDNFDGALSFYLRAARRSENDAETSEILQRKIAQMRENIRSRDESLLRADFDKIDQEVAARRFDEAAEMAQSLARRFEDGSTRVRCMEKLASVYIEEARDYNNSVRTPQAEEAYRRAISSYPAGALARFELAELIKSSPARGDEAFELYRVAIDLALEDPGLIDAARLLLYRHDYARLQLKRSNYREAAALFWIVTQADSALRFPRAVESIIEAYTAIAPDLVSDSEENNEPIEILHAIVEKYPADARARFLLGKIYFERGDHDEALPLLEGAFRNQGALGGGANLAEIHFFLGACYRDAGRDRDAARHLRSLLELQPSRYGALCELGEIYLDLLDYNLARTQFDRAIRIEPTNFRAYRGQGKALFQVNRLADALTSYETLVELSPENADHWFQLGIVQSELGRHEQAYQTYRKVLDRMKNRDPDDQEVRSVLSQVYTHLGLSSVSQNNYYEAIGQFDEALSYGGNRAEALGGKAQAYRELGRLSLAEDFFKQAVEADPNKLELLLNIGVFYQRFKKDPDAALVYYYAYFEKGGTDPNVREWIRECGGVDPS